MNLIQTLKVIENNYYSDEKKAEATIEKLNKKRKSNITLNSILNGDITCKEAYENEYGCLAKRWLLSLLPCKPSKKNKTRKELADIFGERGLQFSKFKCITSPFLWSGGGYLLGSLDLNFINVSEPGYHALISIGGPGLIALVANYFVNQDFLVLYDEFNSFQKKIEKLGI